MSAKQTAGPPTADRHGQRREPDGRDPQDRQREREEDPVGLQDDRDRRPQQAEDRAQEQQQRASDEDPDPRLAEPGRRRPGRVRR